MRKNDWYNKLFNEQEPFKRKCKRCGTLVYVYKDKKLCRVCNYYVFKNNLEEFKYRVKEKSVN